MAEMYCLGGDGWRIMTLCKLLDDWSRELSRGVFGGSKLGFSGLYRLPFGRVDVDLATILGMSDHCQPLEY